MTKQLSYAAIIAAAVLFAAVTAHCQEPILPDAPSMSKRTVDKKFIALTAATAILTTADLYTTIAPGMHERAGCWYEVGTPTFYSRKPQDHQARAAAVMAGEVALSTFAAYLLKKHGHNRLWVAPLAYTATIHARGAIHNFRNCR